MTKTPEPQNMPCPSKFKYDTSEYRMLPPRPYTVRERVLAEAFLELRAEFTAEIKRQHGQASQLVSVTEHKKPEAITLAAEIMSPAMTAGIEQAADTLNVEQYPLKKGLNPRNKHIVLPLIDPDKPNTVETTTTPMSESLNRPDIAHTPMSETPTLESLLAKVPEGWNWNLYNNWPGKGTYQIELTGTLECPVSYIGRGFTVILALSDALNQLNTQGEKA